MTAERFRQEPGKTLHDFLKRDQTWTRSRATPNGWGEPNGKGETPPNGKGVRDDSCQVSAPRSRSWLSGRSRSQQHRTPPPAAGE